KVQDIDDPGIILRLFLVQHEQKNHHVREWAPQKLVGAHDDFSAAR
ncbi:unnamed protein product, partial [marine sediment metagenome]